MTAAKPFFDRTVVVGLGGIFYRLYAILSEESVSLPEAPKELVLVDGDKFEEKNMRRQGISQKDVGRMKADVWAERLRLRFYPNLTLRSVPVFLVENNVADIIPDRSLVISAVDNHATRKLISKHLQKLKDAVLISGGNELSEGNTQLYVRLDGKDRTLPIEKLHPEIEEAKDKNPGDMSCEERAALPGGEQQAEANMAAALCMVNRFRDILSALSSPARRKEVEEGRIIAEVFFDLKDCSFGSYYRGVATDKLDPVSTHP